MDATTGRAVLDGRDEGRAVLDGQDEGRAVLGCTLQQRDVR